MARSEINLANSSDKGLLARRAEFIRGQLPPEGLFAGMDWRVSPLPFSLGPSLAKEIESLGRVLLQFYKAVNLLYRQSIAGKQPEWVAQWLDLGKPRELIAWQRDNAFKNDIPRVIRPDILITDSGLAITELDSVPGGIGLTGWLNKTYSQPELQNDHPAPAVLGGSRGMLEGFSSIFNGAKRVHLVVSEESGTYRPEMEWVAHQLDPARFAVRDTNFKAFEEGDAVYRFFELFDLKNIPNGAELLQAAQKKQIQFTPPPKPMFEEKMLFGLLWNRNLREFWRRELGESFFEKMLHLIPRTWVVDPSPLPPHGAIPELNLTDWRQLKTLSQKDRDLILKISGYSELAWGARGVYLGSDLAAADWSAAVDAALDSFSRSPYVLQRYHKPKLIQSEWYDFEKAELASMSARVRLCPYYFVAGPIDNAKASLGGILATICPADKKIIHGMKDAILAPCSA